MKRLASAFIVVLTLASACGGAQLKQENLFDDIYAYNEGVRWHQYPKAASHLHPKERNQFITELMELEDELKIAEWELIHLEYVNDDRSKVDVQVRYTWHLDSKGVVHTTNTLQSWTLHGKRWMVTGEKRLAGEPMPLIAEPDEADAETEPEEGESKEESPEDPEIGGGQAQARPTVSHMLVEFR